MGDELEVFTLETFFKNADEGPDGIYTLRGADTELLCPLGVLTRSTQRLLRHRGEPDGVRVRIERRLEHIEGPYLLEEIMDREGLYVERGDELTAFVTDYSVGMCGVDGVTLRTVGRPSEVYTPLASVLSKWFPDDPSVRGVRRDELLDAFGTEHRVKVVGVYERRLPLAGFITRR